MMSLGPLELVVVLSRLLPIVALVAAIGVTLASCYWLYLSWRR